MMGVSLRRLLAVCLIAGTSAVSATEYRIEEVATGLHYPWCIAFLPNGDYLVTERNGSLRIIRSGVLDPQPIAGVPPVYTKSHGAFFGILHPQAGLFDVLLHPRFESNRVVYLSYSHGTDGANATRVARARFDGVALTNLRVIFEAKPLKDTPVHYGGRMMFLPDGTLLVTIGEGFNFREEAQKLTSHLGTTVRIHSDGSVPADNPFLRRPNALPEIYTYGHRNAQGLAYDRSTRRIYLTEHGARGGDELNVLVPGENYGWPAVTHGIDYLGGGISPYQELPGMHPPLDYWVPSIAVSGLTFYDGDAFPEWRGDLFVPALLDGHVERIDMADGEVRGRQRLFDDIAPRIRDVRAGPDGYLYILTDADPGRMLRVRPAG